MWPVAGDGWSVEDLAVIGTEFMDTIPGFSCYTGKGTGRNLRIEGSLTEEE
jgi:hypothetical protein